MWTDEQLKEQGWTQPQIDQWRIEQPPLVETVLATPEPAVPITSTEPSIPIAETKPGLLSSATTGITPDKTQIVLIVIMLIVAPLSLYSSLFAQGPTGPQGEDGLAGENGTAGSSFHLVLTNDELPTCDQSINNQIFFVADVSGFEVCQNNAWTVVNLTGASGQDGADGNDGSNGVDGNNGTDGADGQDGTNGLNGANGQDGQDGQDGSQGLTSLIVSRTEPAGSNCQNGGILVETGLDDDGNGALSVNEVDSILFVCNGDTGQDGQDGLDGQDGQDGVNGSSTGTMMVARLTTAPASMNCNGTGELLEQGMDDGRGGAVAQNGVLESSEVLFRTLICTQFDVALAEDFNPGGSGSNPSDFAIINSTMYFSGSNGTTSGVWAYENGTTSLAFTGSAMGMRAVGHLLMFMGSTGEPWVYEPSNGTAWEIADIFPGNQFSYPGEYTLIGTTVFFGARDSAGSTGMGLFDLWAYETGNHSVWKVAADTQPTELVAVNGDLYFAARDAQGDTELWKHEMATNLTFTTADIRPGILSSSPEHFAVMGSTIYMSALAGTTYGNEVYAFNTVNNSTWLVADLRPGTAGSFSEDLTVFGTRVYMRATSGTYFELWAYESTNHSFWEVSSFQSTSGSGGPSGFAVFDGKLYFRADDGSGAELWATSPTNESIWLVKDIHPTAGSSPSEMVEFAGALHFTADDGTNGRERWSVSAFNQTITFV